MSEYELESALRVDQEIATEQRDRNRKRKLAQKMVVRMLNELAVSLDGKGQSEDAERLETLAKAMQYLFKTEV